jgi:hypothetical protein
LKKQGGNLNEIKRKRTGSTGTGWRFGGTISMLSLAYVIFETEKTHGEKAAKKVTSEILGRFQGEKKENVARFVADAIDDFEKMYRGDEHE